MIIRTFNSYLRERFGERVHKVSVDAGFTCPNRDGTKAVGGCIYCNNESFNFSPPVPVKEQLRQGIEKAKHRFRARKFIAYFQAYSNTYAEPQLLYDVYSTIFDFPEIVGISIGTRPDCVSEDTLRVIEKFVPTHEVWIEYGLESSNDDSLRRINRAHTFSDFKEAVFLTAGRGIKIGTHVIVGFPWESEETILQTARDLSSLPIDGIKIHNLHIVRGTALEKMHERSPFRLLGLDDYAILVSKMLRILPPNIIVMRMTAECPQELLIAPEWCNQKALILDAIQAHLHSSELRHDNTD
jgi:radical SAM protein (TIGR01212 family)